MKSFILILVLLAISGHYLPVSAAGLNAECGNTSEEGGNTLQLCDGGHQVPEGGSQMFPEGGHG